MRIFAVLIVVPIMLVLAGCSNVITDEPDFNPTPVIEMYNYPGTLTGETEFTSRTVFREDEIEVLIFIDRLRGFVSVNPTRSFDHIQGVVSSEQTPQFTLMAIDPGKSGQARPETIYIYLYRAESQNKPWQHENTGILAYGEIVELGLVGGPKVYWNPFEGFIGKRKPSGEIGLSLEVWLERGK